MMPSNMSTDNFDRTGMLEFWADDIIIPTYDQYSILLADLDNSRVDFTEDPTISNLTLLREAWLAAYHGWQEVAFFNIGMAESIGLINHSNIYPTNTDLIDENISDQNLSFELPSNFPAQGFPALDYLLFGIAENDDEILQLLSSENYTNYLTGLTETLVNLTEEVRSDWELGFRDTFIANNGSSGSASVDKLANDFIFHYERFFRAGKVGIPAGVFTGNPLADAVEAPHANIYSKELFTTAFNALVDFFEGKSVLGNPDGPSLDAYLEEIIESNDLHPINEDILNQWEMVPAKLDAVSESFKEQLQNDNSRMLELYDELQKAVVFLKVDMMQALNIQVDFVDADGD